MKTITLTFLFFLIGINMAFSQARRTEQQEKIAYIKKQFSESYATTRQAAIDTAGLFKVFVKHKQMFIGEKLSFLLDLLREYKVPIRFLSGSTTSPWIDPKGLAYVREITISYKDFYTIDELWNSDHPTIWLNIIPRKPYMELGKFVDKYHLEEDNMPDQDKVFLMKDDFIIEDLNWEYTRDEPTTEADE